MTAAGAWTEAGTLAAGDLIVTMIDGEDVPATVHDILRGSTGNANFALLGLITADGVRRPVPVPSVTMVLRLRQNTARAA